MDIYFNFFKIKFMRLADKIRELNLRDVKNVNVFINLESVVWLLHKPHIEEALVVATKEQFNDARINFISNVINLAAHYRNFFTKAHVQSNIIFFYNDFQHQKKFNNVSFVKDYRKNWCKFFNRDEYKLTNQIILDGMNVVNTIIEYIDSVFILNSDRLESSCIPYLCSKEKKLKADINFIVTRDMYDFQYVNHGFMILYPDKEETIILNRKNLMQYLLYKNNMNIEDGSRIELPTLLYSFIYSIMGDKKRDLPKVRGVGFKKLYKSLEKLLTKDYISEYDEKTCSIEHLAEFIKDNDGLFKLELKATIAKNYFSVDVERQMNITDNYMLDPILNQIQNHYDNRNLKKLNDKVFYKFPLHLEELNNYYPRILS